MNVVSRGIKNAFRSPLRSGAIILMLTISIGLILSMLVAKSSVDTKISSVKANSGTVVTISPAGVMGFSGGGTPLTAAQLTTITKTTHIASTSATLSDQMGTSDTNLASSIELGSFGARQQRFSSESSSTNGNGFVASNDSTTPTEMAARVMPTPRITVTGTTNPNSVSTDGNSLKLTSGKTIDGNSSSLIALIGSDLATKNNLTVGSTFTAYGSTITVSGIFSTSNKFQDSGIIMPLTSVQNLTSQTGAVTSVIAKVDSSDNVNAVVTSLKSSLGTAADITSQAEQAAASVSSLQSISGLAFAGVIGAALAGAAIILLAMVMIVRERRHEIGVIKAIGGSNRKVIGQFISEALTLTIVGSIVGLVFGVLVSGPMTNSLVSSQNSSQSTSTQPERGGFSAATGAVRRSFGQIGNNFTQVTSSVTPAVFISAIGITLLIAIIGSAIPAWFIARIRPAEVLRTE